MHLVVTRDFATHKRGEAITDPAEIAEVLAGDHLDHVVRTARLAHEVAVDAAPEEAPKE